MLHALAAIAATTVLLPGPAAASISDQPAAAATSKASQAEPLTAAQAAAVELATRRGERMYAYDQAAWHGTDDMVAQMKAARSYEALAPTIAGWVVEGPATAPVVTFLNNDPSTPRALYRAKMTASGTAVAGGRLLGDGPEQTATPAQLALFRALRAARSAAEEQRIGMCSGKRPNSIVLPPEEPDGPTLVYLMTPQTEDNQYPLGGHWRFAVDADGRAGTARKFTNICLTLGTKLERDEAATFMMVTHLLDPVPTEVHVFTMLTSATSILVATTDKSLWTIDRKGGRVVIERTQLDATAK